MLGGDDSTRCEISTPPSPQNLAQGLFSLNLIAAWDLARRAIAHADHAHAGIMQGKKRRPGTSTWREPNDAIRSRLGETLGEKVAPLFIAPIKDGRRHEPVPAQLPTQKQDEIAMPRESGKPKDRNWDPNHTANVKVPVKLPAVEHRPRAANSPKQPFSFETRKDPADERERKI